MVWVTNVIVMKNLIPKIGGLLILTNFICAFIFESYNLNNLFFSSLSLIISSILLYFIYISHSENALKIGYALFLIITGSIRFLLAILSPPEIKNNYILLFILIIFIIELIIFFIFKPLREK